MFGKIENSVKRIASAALALSIAVGSFGVYADSPKFAPENKEPALTNLEKFSKYTKEHRGVTLAGMLGIGVAASLAVVGGRWAVDTYRLRGTSIDVDTWDDATLQRNLDNEIAQFEQKGFEVTDNARTQVPAKVLYLFMRRINLIINEYPNIIEKYRRQMASQTKIFRITAEFCHLTAGGEAPAATVCGQGEFIIHSHFFKDLRQAKLDILSNIRSGHNAPCDLNKLLEVSAAHEMGHIIQYALCNDTGLEVVDNTTYKKGEIGWSPFGATSLQATPMKEEIISKAIESDRIGSISKYGDEDAQEWFAEVCAHAFCSETPNALGTAMREFLQEQEQKLSTAFAAVSDVA